MQLPENRPTESWQPSYQHKAMGSAYAYVETKPCYVCARQADPSTNFVYTSRTMLTVCFDCQGAIRPSRVGK